MSGLIKSIAVLMIVSLIAGSNGATISSENVFAVAEKLANLMDAFSNTKLSWEEQNQLQNFQVTLMNVWFTVINTIQNIDPARTMDALIALAQNQQQLLAQTMSIFNTEELNKWMEMFTSTLRNVTINENFTSPSLNFSTTDYPTTWYPFYNVTDSTWNWNSNTTWYPNYNFTDTTWYPTYNYTDSTWNWNYNTTWYPNYNFTETTWYPTFNVTDSTWNWNYNTTWYPNYNFTETTWYPTFNVTESTWNWNSNTTWYPNYNFTDTTWYPTYNVTDSTWNWNSNTTWYPNYNFTDATVYPTFNFTDSTWNWNSNTTWYPNYNFTDSSTPYPNFNSTDGCNGSCTWSPSTNFSTSTNPSTVLLSTVSLSPDQIFIDSIYCNYYTQDDCKQKVEISLLCPAKCRCQNHFCNNNGTLAIAGDLQTCKCLCTSGFTGQFCEVDVCPEKEYCVYFTNSYCTNDMIFENCPKLCGRC